MSDTKYIPVRTVPKLFAVPYRLHYIAIYSLSQASRVMHETFSRRVQLNGKWIFVRLIISFSYIDNFSKIDIFLISTFINLIYLLISNFVKSQN